MEAVGGSVSDGPRSSPSLIPIPIVIDISHINYHCPRFHCNRHDCLHLQMLQVLTFPLTLIIFHGKVDFGGVFPFGITRLDTFCLDVYEWSSILAPFTLSFTAFCVSPILLSILRRAWIVFQLIPRGWKTWDISHEMWLWTKNSQP